MWMCLQFKVVPNYICNNYFLKKVWKASEIFFLLMEENRPANKYRVSNLVELRCGNAHLLGDRKWILRINMAGLPATASNCWTLPQRRLSECEVESSFCCILLWWRTLGVPPVCLSNFALPHRVIYFDASDSHCYHSARFIYYLQCRSLAWCWKHSTVARLCHTAFRWYIKQKGWRQVRTVNRGAIAFPRVWDSCQGSMILLFYFIFVIL